MDGQIFSDSLGTNPYNPSNDGGQFELPLSIIDAATDLHGQIEGQYLDQLFNYVLFGDGNGIEDNGGSLEFSDDLKMLFADTYAYNRVEENIVAAQECLDDLGLKDIKTYDFPKGKIPLGRCEGDCDTDSDCNGDLLCWQRDCTKECVPVNNAGCVLLGLGCVSCTTTCKSGATGKTSVTDGMQNPPGCKGKARGEKDYCYDPTYEECDETKKKFEQIRDLLATGGGGIQNLDESIKLLFGTKTVRLWNHLPLSFMTMITHIIVWHTSCRPLVRYVHMLGGLNFKP